MLGQRLRRWLNIKTTLVQRLVMAGMTVVYFTLPPVITTSFLRIGYVHPMLLWCWASVADGGPSIYQHWGVC